MLQQLGGRGTIKRVVDTHGPKERRTLIRIGCILRQAIVFESTLGIGLVIHLPSPTFVVQVEVPKRMSGESGIR
jgi:hypothetical protein